MVHQEKPQHLLRLFCCTIPSGTDSHFAQALVFASRGLVAKNAPQEHFLNAPTDGAPQQQNPNFFPIGEGFGFFVFFGKQNESLASIEKRPRPYHKKARQTTVRVP